MRLTDAKTARPEAICAIALLLFASGCATSFREYFENGFKVGPNYGRPAVPVAEEWIDYQNTQLVRRPPDLSAWWRVFNDPILENLVQTAHQQNLSLREAGFRVLQARANLAVTSGGLWPQTQQLYGSYTRTQQSLESGGFGAIASTGGGGAGGGGGGGGGAGGGTGIQTGFGPGRNFDTWTLGSRLAWELDFWGRFRRAVEAADAQLEASVEDYDDVLVMLLGDVADAYVQVRTFEQRLAFARRNVQNQRGSLEVAIQKFQGGATSRLDVTQAQTTVAQTEATIPQIEIQLRQAQNRLCILMGIPPQRLDALLDGPPVIPQAPVEIVVGVPADLIRRRPDVRQAERLLAAQSARIGIAEAELYPAFSITGSLSLQANQFSELFQSSAVAGNVGPSFNWNILGYGRIRSNIQAVEAQFQQNVAQYQNTVLNANREAEDALVGFLRSQQRARILAEGAAAAEESRDLVVSLYRGGRADFGRVFIAEQALVEQQDQLAQARGAISQNLVGVFRALGGGWEIRLDPATVPPVLPAPAEVLPAPLPEPAAQPPLGGPALGN